MKSKASKSKNSKLTNVLYKDNNMFMLLILALVIIIIIFLFRRKNSKPYESFRTRKRKIETYLTYNIDDYVPPTGEDDGPLTTDNDVPRVSDDESDMIYYEAPSMSDADIPLTKTSDGNGIQGEQCRKLNSTLNKIFKDNHEYKELIALQNNLSTSITENTNSINDFTNDKINIETLIQDTVSDILKNSKIESTIISKFDSNFNSLRNTILKNYNENNVLFQSKINKLGEIITTLKDVNLDDTVKNSINNLINERVAMNFSS